MASKLTIYYDLNLDWDMVLTVPGNPKALKRHRTFQKGKFTGTYDPSLNDKSDFLAKAVQNKPSVPYNEALLVLFEFKFARPKNHYRTGANANKLKISAPLFHTSTPDADNLTKFVCDSLNGIFWKDDSCISEQIISKTYSETPGVVIKIFSLQRQEIQGNIFD